MLDNFIRYYFYFNQLVILIFFVNLNSCKILHRFYEQALNISINFLNKLNDRNLKLLFENSIPVPEESI